MTTLAANDVAEPVVAGEIIILDPADVAIGERLRDIDRVHAEALGRSMIKDGQISPIDVCRLPGKPGWHLAGPGGHRLTGARIVGMDGIEAREVSSSLRSRRRREAVENLFRRENDPIERAAAIAELVQIKREEAGLDDRRRVFSVRRTFKQTVTAEAGETLETISNVYGWSEELGAELGFTGRTIRNDLMLYRGLRPSLVTRLRQARHSVLRNASQLRALAKLEEGNQAMVVDMLTGGQARNVAEASRRLAPAKAAATPETKRQNAFLGAFGRMSIAERKGALALLRDLLPAGFELVERAA